MAIFGSTTTTACTSSSAEVYTPTSAGLQQNVTLVNQGANAVFVGSFTAVTAVTGLKVPPGGQLTLQAVEEAVFAICASGKTSSVVSGLSTVASVV